MKLSVTRRAIRIGLGYFLAWTVVGLFFFTREASRRAYFNEQFDWRNLLTIWVVGEHIWAIVAIAVWWFATRWPLERAALGRRIALHLFLSGIIAALQLALETTAYLLLGTFPPGLSSSFWRAWSTLVVLGFHGNVISYWVILGVVTGYRHYRRLREREAQAMRLEVRSAELSAQLARAQMNALKMQLQPHFLFNTLNAIMVLVRQQNAARAEEMLGRLSDLLRCVLDEGEAQEVPLRRELEYARLYLAIEQVRFAERLSVSVVADSGVLDAAVPHMALQPLVENAIRHGIARTSVPGAIEITASASGGELTIRVRNDGPGVSRSNGSEGWGIGLANTRARLQQLYGDAASLTVEDTASGVLVTMTLPLRMASHAESTEAFA